jgi:hypothetical protein
MNNLPFEENVLRVINNAQFKVFTGTDKCYLL